MPFYSRVCEESEQAIVLTPACFVCCHLDHIFVLYPVFLKSKLIAVSLLFFCVLKRNFFMLFVLYKCLLSWKSILRTLDCFDFVDSASGRHRGEAMDTCAPLHAWTKDYFLLHVNTNVQKQKHILSFIPHETPDFLS